MTLDHACIQLTGAASQAGSEPKPQLWWDTPAQLSPTLLFFLICTTGNSFSSKYRNYIIWNAFQPPTAPSHHPSLGLMNTCVFMSHANNLVLVAVSLKSENSQQPNHTSHRHNFRLGEFSVRELYCGESWAIQPLETKSFLFPRWTISQVMVGSLGVMPLFLTSQLPHRSLKPND